MLLPAGAAAHVPATSASSTPDASFGPASYGTGSPYQGFANQFAAMPSLHFGWALVVAWSVIIATTEPTALALVLHPVLTLAAIVLTANHYWLDAIVATLRSSRGALLLDHWRIRRARPSSPASA